MELTAAPTAIPARNGGFFHVGAGLGDVARRFYLTDTYERLASLEEPTFILCFSHNPSAMDFFRFHPNHRNLVTCDLGHIYLSLQSDPSFDNRELNRKLFSLCGFTPEQDLSRRREPKPIGHFHAPDSLGNITGHVVLHPFGRGWGDWPPATCELVKTALRAVPASVGIFVVSADYTSPEGRRKTETFSCDLPNVTVLKNLSGPATFSLVASASRFIGTGSALAQVAAFERIPSVILHPQRCSDFKPPYNAYSRTVWDSNGISVPFDACPLPELRESLERFLRNPEAVPVMREEFASFAPIRAL